MERLDSSCIVGSSVNGAAAAENRLALLKWLDVALPCDSAISLLDVYPG